MKQATAPQPGPHDDGTAATAPVGASAHRQAVDEHFSSTAEQYAASEQRGGDDLERIVDLVGAERPRSVLDVATGPGSTALALAAVAERVVGVDTAAGMVDTARRRASEAGAPGVTFEQAGVESLPFGDGAFDAVTCRIAAHHFQDVPRAVAEMARVLRVGGLLVVLDSLAPDDPATAAYLHRLEAVRDPTHVRSLTEREWVDVLRRVGLVVEGTERWAKPKDAARWVERGSADPDARAEARRLLREAPSAVVAEWRLDVGPDGEVAHMADDKVLVVARRPSVVDDRRPGHPVRVDHVQVAAPVGAEAAAVDFYAGVLGLTPVAKPEALAVRGGCWFSSPWVEIHVGVEDDFRPARKAHPALVVDDLDALVARLDRAGTGVRWDTEMADLRRCFVDDPFGNRIELIDQVREVEHGARGEAGGAAGTMDG